MRPHSLGLLAEALLAASHPAEALDVVDEALAIIGATGERWYEAELYRLKGELLLKRDASAIDAAESNVLQAMAIAREQHARAIELRAAVSPGASRADPRAALLRGRCHRADPRDVHGWPRHARRVRGEGTARHGDRRMRSGAPGTFGAQLKKLREAAGFTQEELATIAGLSVHAVSALERGQRQRPQVDTVRALSAASTSPPRPAINC